MCTEFRFPKFNVALTIDFIILRCISVQHPQNKKITLQNNQQKIPIYLAQWCSHNMPTENRLFHIPLLIVYVVIIVI